MINSKRINKITEYVDKKIVAEIGADHGYITKQLFEQNKVNFAYLTDISAKSLSKAKKNLSNYAGKTNFLVGDGLQVFENVKLEIPPKQIIIAGMGGNEIIKILSTNIVFNNFVLQPQKNAIELRQFLTDNNYSILKDEVVKEGKLFYSVLKVKKTNRKQTLTKKQLLFGKTNLKKYSSDFISFLHFQREFCENILKNKMVEEILYKKDLICDILKSIKENTNV